jgi:hypothetical protein
MTVTPEEIALVRIYEALYDMDGKTLELFEALRKAAPHVSKINHKIKEEVSKATAPRGA